MSSFLPSSLPWKQDVLLGGATVLGIWVLQKIVHLVSSPSLKKVRQQCSKPMPVLKGDDNAVILWGFEGQGEYVEYGNGVSDASYYVSRVEAYCRAAQVPFTKLASQGGSENPRGKVPFAKVKGQMTDESGKILTLIKRDFVDIDKDLSQQQRVTGHFVSAVLNGSLYWVTLHFIFHTEDGRKVFRSEIAHTLPPVVVDLVHAMAQRSIHANLHGHGMGRMPEEDIIVQARADFQVLSHTLGTQAFLLGTRQPCSHDCDLYAMLALFFGHTFFASLPWVKEVRKEFANLDTYFTKMKDLLYPELKANETKKEK